jgi:CRISPR-associated protein Csy1
MLDPAIQNFLNERKEIWLKKKITNTTNDEDKAAFERQALDEFSLATWLPDAAKRAQQLSIVTHPGKFSHPSAKISSIIATSKRSADGLLRTGNVDVGFDVFGNAAAMDVHKFLSLMLSNNETVLMHLEQKTAEIEQQLTIPGTAFSDIKQGLLAIKQDDDSAPKTSGKVKQIYFPVDEHNYHLLSILTPSNVMFKLKERINNMRFSDEAKEVREAKKNNRHHENDLSEVYGLSVVGFGGTKPQNISVLNSQNGGTAYLLSSMPPVLNARTIQPPKTNFFSNTLWVKAYQDDFQKLHALFAGDTNNIHIRKKRDWLTRSIIYQVSDRLWMIRYLEAGWSESDTYQQLPKYQKIWLDQFYTDTREDNADWLDAVKDDLSLWFLHAYKKIMDNKALSLGDEQLPYFKSMIEDCEEALR